MMSRSSSLGKLTNLNNNNNKLTERGQWVDGTDQELGGRMDDRSIGGLQRSDTGRAGSVRVSPMVQFDLL